MNANINLLLRKACDAILYPNITSYSLSALTKFADTTTTLICTLMNPPAPQMMSLLTSTMLVLAGVDHFASLADLKGHFKVRHHSYLPHQIQQQENQVHQKSVTSRKQQHNEVLCHDDLNPDPSFGKHLVVNGFDVSDAFRAMVASLTAHKWKQSLEDNLILALASTSVLLLDPHKYSNEIKPFFGQDDWWAINDYIQQVFNIKRLPLPLTTTTNFLSVIEQLLNNDIDRDTSEIQLKTMPLQAKEKRMAKALANLVSKLPFVALDEDINETELCSRFVEPFLAGLFDDPAKGIYLRWTNERTLEAKANESSQSRPDLCITKCCGVNWTTSLAYGEAKPAVHSYDNYLVCKDLIRVAVFCKEALDKQLFEGILGIQIIGRMVVFYLLTLPSQGLYTLIPLANIKIPDSIQNLPALVTEAPAILKVLDVFDRLCVRAACPNVISDRYAPTLPIDSIQQLFSESKSRKRQCVLQHRHN